MPTGNELAEELVAAVCRRTPEEARGRRAADVAAGMAALRP